jgi:hypothetical protein
LTPLLYEEPIYLFIISYDFYVILFMKAPGLVLGYVSDELCLYDPIVKWLF